VVRPESTFIIKMGIPKQKQAVCLNYASVYAGLQGGTGCCGRGIEGRGVLSVTALGVVMMLIQLHSFGLSTKQNTYNHELRQDYLLGLTGLPICQDECLQLSGTNGTWFQDWDFSREHGQYGKNLVYPNGPYVASQDGPFRPDGDSPFLWRTSWRWIDSSPNCRVDVFTKEKMCRVLRKLGVARILFYGDSLSQGMYTAFMNKLGDVDASSGLSGRFSCGEGGNDTVDVLHDRDSGGNANPRSPRGVYELSPRVKLFFSEALRGRVLGIFNIGAHYFNFSHFREDMDVMLDEVSNLTRDQDLYFFRSTSPAHEGCEPQNKNFNWTRGPRVSPLKSYGEYEVSSNHKFDWDRFVHYNHYARERIYDYNARGGGPPVHYLNIWNMTALRRDGHAAPADCLHYMEPGPVDWWNHMMFTYLQRMSQKVVEENDDLRGNCRRLRPGVVDALP